MVTTTFPIINECDQISGKISKQISITWTGTLQHAVAGGSLSGDFVGIANVNGYIQINGVQVPIAVTTGGLGTHVDGSISIVLANWLRQGSNEIDVGFNSSFGVAGEVQICCTLQLVVTTTGTISTPPPVPPGGGSGLTSDLEIIAFIVVVVVVLAVFLKVKK